MRAAVGFALDVSGSTRDLYRQGIIQRAVEQIMPVGLQFDDNGSLDGWTFSEGEDMIAELAQATRENYQNFVQREILGSGVPKWSGTDYAPVIKLMLKKYGFYGNGAPAKRGGFLKRLLGGDSATGQSGNLRAQSGSGEAVINYFVTDGQNDDQDETYHLLRECQSAKVNMYFLFMGVGDPSRFGFLTKIAEDFGNVGFLSIAELEKFVDSDDIYEKLLPEELTGWLRQKQG